MIAAMIDRDGTMSDVGGYCHPDDFELFPETASAFGLLNQHRIPIVIISNQTGIGDGRFSEGQLRQSTRRMLENLADAEAFVDAIYYCTRRDPHLCKPNPTILYRAAADLGFDLNSSFMIGDSGYSDILAAALAGCRSILVLSGWGRTSLDEYRDDWREAEPEFICDGILDAAKLVCGLTSRQAPRERREVRVNVV